MTGQDDMLFSIPESGWWKIAVAATAFFLLAMRALPYGLKIPAAVRAEWAEQGRRRTWALYLLTPLVAGGVLAISLLRPGPSSPILFLYSVAFAAIPLAVFPVRGRMLRAYLAQRGAPDAPEKPDWLSAAWIVAVLSVVLLGAVIALMSATYDPGS
ncbi:hypothetical protein [Actinomadura verrucosospora]|uniref:Putative spermidine/putrescine ABC transporter, permease protein n=1 Tax=Actinomadura verrucosospora TaxID=46165 RepID=A0A7D4A008_ACTVE|nr:hypothetical protein [Actinomadura verrucosospora]QKG24766.1 putative spermidine/putrescine ABC transporter, permease protein [Actinomadura verrucosospora]